MKHFTKLLLSFDLDNWSMICFSVAVFCQSVINSAYAASCVNDARVLCVLGLALTAVVTHLSAFLTTSTCFYTEAITLRPSHSFWQRDTK